MLILEHHHISIDKIPGRARELNGSMYLFSSSCAFSCKFRLESKLAFYIIARTPWSRPPEASSPKTSLLIKKMFSGKTDYRCACPDDQAPLVRQGRQATYITSYKGPVCTKKKATDVAGDKKSYKGTLQGGLKLTEDSREESRLPVMAVVDDIAKSTGVNVEKMKGEHFKDPTHFGIHISQLETLKGDKVKESEPVDKSIIANMFD